LKADPAMSAVELLAWLPIVARHKAHAVNSLARGCHRAESKGPGAQPRRATGRCESALCRATNYVICAMRLLLPQGRTGARLWGLFYARATVTLLAARKARRVLRCPTGPKLQRASRFRVTVPGQAGLFRSASRRSLAGWHRSGSDSESAGRAGAQGPGAEGHVAPAARPALPVAAAGRAGRGWARAIAPAAGQV
jgi:hypothetical protein